MLTKLISLGLVASAACINKSTAICGCRDKRYTDYTGSLNVTESGKECEHWSRTKYSDLTSNYCRNPDGSETAWCYVDVENDIRESCHIEDCGCQDYDADECGCSKFGEADYRGTISETVTGAKCQAWASQSPWQHYYRPDSSKYQYDGLDGNYCRNPQHEAAAPWCYVADGSVRWDYCEIPVCDSTSTTTTTCEYQEEGCSCPGSQDLGYQGTEDHTRYGELCINWTSGRNPVYRHLPANYCRNISEEEPRAWCYTNVEGSWGYCDIPTCGPVTDPSGGDCEGANPELCGCDSVKKADYEGDLDKTRGGEQCLLWSVGLNPKYRGLPENYCRNYKSEDDAPWCYTDKDGSWDYCAVPSCRTANCEGSVPTLCGCAEKKGSDYVGQIAKTRKDVECLDWSSALNPKYRHLPENYCRNWGATEPEPWCYTDVDGGWDYCSIQTCGCDNVDQMTCGCSKLNGADYRGNRSVNVKGKECQAWSSQYPNRHHYKPDSPKYQFDDLDSNYCRNPGMSEDKPWCFSADEEGWEYCNIPVCDDTTTSTTTIELKCYGSNPLYCGCKEVKGSDYIGTENVTASEDECIEWKYSANPKYRSLPSNYCRNLDMDDEKPWCYINLEGYWMYCDIPECGCEGFDADECGCSVLSQSDYRGVISTTRSGKECRTWASPTDVTHEFKPELYPYDGLEKNYCRNPGMSNLAAWCYTKDDQEDWEYCNVDFCDDDTTNSTTTRSPECEDAIDELCSCKGSKGKYYNGTLAVTKDGGECVNWSQQGSFPDMPKNYCRNPLVLMDEPWCFVSEDEWGFCDVPECGCDNYNPETCGCSAVKQADYRGTVHQTIDGKECQKWASQEPWPHGYDPNSEEFSSAGLDSNYCRNPNADEGGPWCYVADGSTRYGYCDVEPCPENTTTEKVTTSSTTSTTTSTTSVTHNTPPWSIRLHKLWAPYEGDYVKGGDFKVHQCGMTPWIDNDDYVLAYQEGSKGKGPIKLRRYNIYGEIIGDDTVVKNEAGANGRIEFILCKSDGTIDIGVHLSKRTTVYIHRLSDGGAITSYQPMDFDHTCVNAATYGDKVYLTSDKDGDMTTNHGIFNLRGENIHGKLWDPWEVKQTRNFLRCTGLAVTADGSELVHIRTVNAYMIAFQKTSSTELRRIGGEIQPKVRGNGAGRYIARTDPVAGLIHVYTPSIIVVHPNNLSKVRFSGSGGSSSRVAGAQLPLLNSGGYYQHIIVFPKMRNLPNWTGMTEYINMYNTWKRSTVQVTAQAYMKLENPKEVGLVIGRYRDTGEAYFRHYAVYRSKRYGDIVLGGALDEDWAYNGVGGIKGTLQPSVWDQYFKRYPPHTFSIANPEVGLWIIIDSKNWTIPGGSRAKFIGAGNPKPYRWPLDIRVSFPTGESVVEHRHVWSVPSKTTKYTDYLE